MTHTEPANVEQGHKQTDREAPTSHHRCTEIVTWRGRMHIALIATAAVLLSVVGFSLIRHVASSLRFASTQTRICKRESDTSAGGLGNRLPHSVVTNIPPLSDIIAESRNWQPPIATGHPSPIDRTAALQVVTGDHVLGSHRAPVTLMLFGDLYCRYTLRTFRVLSSLVQEQPSEYRLVWRQRPLDIHPDAPAAAVASERLAFKFDEIAFWRFVNAMSRLKGSASPSDVNTIAESLQTGIAKVNDATASSQAEVRVERDRVIALIYSIHATPTLFINGLRFEGELARRQLDEIINEELDAVEALREELVPQAQAYRIRVDENLLDILRE